MTLPKGLALGLIAAGAIGLVMVLAGSGSVRDYVADNYRRAGSERGALTYTATERPARVAAAIQGAHKPADRRVTPEGIFLRYRRDFVGVFAQARGSRIVVADENRGYGLFYPFIGGWWGSYSGRAESFRGGGPGGAK